MTVRSWTSALSLGLATRVLSTLTVTMLFGTWECVAVYTADKEVEAIGSRLVSSYSSTSQTPEIAAVSPFSASSRGWPFTEESSLLSRPFGREKTKGSAEGLRNITTPSSPGVFGSETRRFTLFSSYSGERARLPLEFTVGVLD